MHAPNMSAQDSGTDTSREQGLPKEVVTLQRARCLAVVRDCHVSSSFSAFFPDSPKCHLGEFELTTALDGELEADNSRCGLCIGF